MGLPSVSVPVLSTTSVSTLAKRSSASAFLIRTPACAPRPVPTMIDIGVARPSAHGQAMISTDDRGDQGVGHRAAAGRTAPRRRRRAIATAITAGTNQPATTSARRWIGARERCASATICTIWASMVSLPTRSARMTKLPDWLTVPPMTGSPGSFSTGMGSPVSIDSSTVLRPSSTTPSTGILSPGRTRSRSPT